MQTNGKFGSQGTEKIIKKNWRDPVYTLTQAKKWQHIWSVLKSLGTRQWGAVILRYRKQDEDKVRSTNAPFPAWRDPAEPGGLWFVEVEPGHGEGCESLSCPQEALGVCREAGSLTLTLIKSLFEECLQVRGRITRGNSAQSSTAGSLSVQCASRVHSVAGKSIPKWNIPVLTQKSLKLKRNGHYKITSLYHLVQNINKGAKYSALQSKIPKSGIQ